MTITDAIEALEDLRDEIRDIKASRGYWHHHNRGLAALVERVRGAVDTIESDVVQQRDEQFSVGCSWQDLAQAFHEHGSARSASWLVESRVIMRNFSAAELDRIHLSAQKKYGRRRLQKLDKPIPMYGNQPITSLVTNIGTALPRNRRKAKKACDAATRRLNAALILLDNCDTPPETQVMSVSFPMAVSVLI